MLAPFTPHIAEELWQEMGYTTSVFAEKWPVYDETKLKTDSIEIALQINGKFRDNLVIGAEDSKDAVLTKAKEVLASRLEGKTVVKEIYVPNKIVNIVVK